MPFSNELGMRIYDPREGEQAGLQMGQMFAQAFQNAQNRSLRQQEMGMDQQKLDMLKKEFAANAKATQMQQLGMKELQDKLDSGMDFKKALFESAPKLYYGKPQELAVILHQERADAATEAFRQKQLDQGERILRHQIDTATHQDTKTLLEHQLKLLQLGEDVRHNKAMETKPTASTNRLPEATKLQLESKLEQLRAVNKEIQTFKTKNVITDIKNPPQEYMVLTNRRLQLQREIDALTKGQAGDVTTPDTSEPPAPKPDSSPFKVGRFTITPE